MKVPVPSSQQSSSSNNNNNSSSSNNTNSNIGSHQSPDPKPISCSTTTTNNNNHSTSGNLNTFIASSTPKLCYEPTSVLDLRRSPSPVSGKPLANNDHLEWEDPGLQNFDWDSIMRELDVHEDSAPPHNSTFQQGVINTSGDESHQIHNQILPEFLAAGPQIDHTQFIHSDFSDIYLNSIPNHNLVSPFDHHHHYPLVHGFPNNNNCNGNSNSNSNWNFGFDLIQELIRAADCFDTNELHLANAILERLNQRLHSPVGRPLQRAAFFFKEALQALLNRQVPCRQVSSWSEIVQAVRAYKTFSGISPIPMFTHFTTNQALLESLEGSPGPFLHVIDFDIGLGCQYPSLMRELVEKASADSRSYNNNSKISSPVLRITAVVTEEFAIETKLVRESLSQFAHELKIRFQIEFVLVRTFEMLSFKAIKFTEGEKTAVLLSPAIFRRLGSMNNVNSFIPDLRRVSPNVVVFTENEGCGESGGSSSFRRNFVNALEYYSMLFESLDAAAPLGAAGGDQWVRKIEMYLLKPRIMAGVEGCRRRAGPAWREVLSGAGMRAVQLSQLADYQAECLVEKVQVKGFCVGKRQGELVLCWHERPLISTSAWKR